MNTNRRSSSSSRTSLVMGVAVLVMVVAGVLGVLAGIATGTDSTPGSQQTKTQTVPACEWETGEGQDICYWDGDTRGNKTGLSYWMVDNGSVQIIDKSGEAR